MLHIPSEHKYHIGRYEDIDIFHTSS